MRARHIPYLVGGFMLTPLVLWLGLWAFVFQGPKVGLDVPLSLSMGIVSLPLVAWFFMCTLGMLSQSIDGGDEFALPRTANVRRLLEALPGIAVFLGVVSLPLLLTVGVAWYLTPAPLVMGLLIAITIRAGEMARATDRTGQGPLVPAVPVEALGVAVKFAGGLLMKAIFAIPLIGWMLREAVYGTDKDRGWFILNVLMTVVLAVAFFGYPALIIAALAATATAFVMVVLVASI
ncbi:MAG: hypothetical protein AAF638_01220 [Pseudomonadota bacterium]